MQQTHLSKISRRAFQSSEGWSKIEASSKWKIHFFLNGIGTLFFLSFSEVLFFQVDQVLPKEFSGPERFSYSLCCIDSHLDLSKLKILLQDLEHIQSKNAGSDFYL